MIFVFLSSFVVFLAIYSSGYVVGLGLLHVSLFPFFVVFCLSRFLCQSQLFLAGQVAMLLCFVVPCSQSSLICVGHCRLWQVSIETSCYFLLLLADSCVVRCVLLVNFNLSVCFKLDKCPTDFRPALLVLLFFVCASQSCWAPQSYSQHPKWSDPLQVCQNQQRSFKLILSGNPRL